MIFFFLFLFKKKIIITLTNSKHSPRLKVKDAVSVNISSKKIESRRDEGGGASRRSFKLKVTYTHVDRLVSGEIGPFYFGHILAC